jgi:hypothetical protein
MNSRKGYGSGVHLLVRYAVCGFGAVSKLGWLVASLSLQMPGFSPRPVHVGFVVDKVVL